MAISSMRHLCATNKEEVVSSPVSALFPRSRNVVDKEPISRLTLSWDRRSEWG